MTGRGALVALMLGVTACGDGGPSRSEAMAAVAADVAVPALQAFADDSQALAEAVDAACAGPTAATVGTALAAVEATRAHWLAAQAVWSGPVMERRVTGAVDWPVDAEAIEDLVTGSAPGELTTEVIAEEVGSDNRGLRALRALLARDDAVERLADERWCDYATAVAGVITGAADDIVADWTGSFDGGPPFEDVVAGSAAQTWLSMFVNDDIQLVRRAGAQSSSDGDVPPPDPAADGAAQLRGVAAVMTALGPLLGDDLDARLQGELDAAITAFDTGNVDAGRSLSADVDRTLTTEVAAQLGVVIGFSDADGDSSG